MRFLAVSVLWLAACDSDEEEAVEDILEGTCAGFCGALVVTVEGEDDEFSISVTNGSHAFGSSCPEGWETDDAKLSCDGNVATVCFADPLEEEVLVGIAWEQGDSEEYPLELVWNDDGTCNTASLTVQAR